MSLFSGELESVGVVLEFVEKAGTPRCQPLMSGPSLYFPPCILTFPFTSCNIFFSFPSFHWIAFIPAHWPFLLFPPGFLLGWLPFLFIFPSFELISLPLASFLFLQLSFLPHKVPTYFLSLLLTSFSSFLLFVFHRITAFSFPFSRSLSASFPSLSAGFLPFSFPFCWLPLLLS